MNIRKSEVKDIDCIMNLVHQAQDYFRQTGIDQWQDGYPQRENIRADIMKQCSYVLDNQQIIGTMYFAIEDDPAYHIIQGQWLTQDQPYAVIHRIVVDQNVKGQGLAKRLLDYAVEICQSQNIQSIRIDTHHDNLSMQRFLTKNDFHACGEITLASGALRIGFEKLLNK